MENREYYEEKLKEVSQGFIEDGIKLFGSEEKFNEFIDKWNSLDSADTYVFMRKELMEDF